MQIHLTFDTHRLVLPLYHQHAVQSALYKLLAQSSPGREIHDVVPAFGERAFRGFVFGALTGKRRIALVQNTPLLYFDGPTQLELRTPVAQIADIFEEVFQPGEQIRLQKNDPFAISDVTITHDAPCTVSPWTITMHTPIIARRTIGSKTVFYEPGQPEFAELMRRNFERKYRSLTGKEAGTFSIAPVTVSSGDRVRLEMKGTPLIGWGGTYILEGEIAGLNFLYDSGLGSKNSAGFGMFTPAE